MWAFFEDGTFYSAVAHVDDPDVMMVRARDKRSADILSEATGSEVLTWKSRDYSFRVIISRTQWDEYVHQKVMSAKATNFKSEVAKNVGYKNGRRFLNALHDVWQVMYDYQNDMKRGGREQEFKDVEDVWDEHPGLAARYGLPPF